jgi:hypothetical protein
MVLATTGITAAADTGIRAVDTGIEYNKTGSSFTGAADTGINAGIKGLILVVSVSNGAETRIPIDALIPVSIFLFFVLSSNCRMSG